MIYRDRNGDPVVYVDEPLPSCDPAAMERDAREHAPRFEPPTDPWLRRRMESFGASEAAALLIATGRRHAEDFPVWVQEMAKPIRVSGGGHWIKAPRLFARKAGLAAPATVTDPMLAGKEREPLLFAQLAAMLKAKTAPAACRLLDPASLRPASSLPQWVYPIRDPYSRLSATPDAWADDVLGDLVAVELKCPTTREPDLRPHYALQNITQMACMEARGGGVLVSGQGWGAHWLDYCGEPNGPVAAWPVAKDDAVIAELREAAGEGWREVERLRGISGWNEVEALRAQKEAA